MPARLSQRVNVAGGGSILHGEARANPGWKEALTSHYDGVRFDFDEHIRRDKAADLDHRRSRANLAEYFAVRSSDLLPVGDMRDEEASPHHVGHARARLCQSRLDISQRLHRLRVRISRTDDLALRIGGRRSRYVNVGTYANSAGVADDRLPGRAG